MGFAWKVLIVFLYYTKKLRTDFFTPLATEDDWSIVLPCCVLWATPYAFAPPTLLKASTEEVRKAWGKVHYSNALITSANGGGGKWRGELGVCMPIRRQNIRKLRVWLARRPNEARGTLLQQCAQCESLGYSVSSCHWPSSATQSCPRRAVLLARRLPNQHVVVPVRKQRACLLRRTFPLSPPTLSKTIISFLHSLLYN